MSHEAEKGAGVISEGAGKASRPGGATPDDPDARVLLPGLVAGLVERTGAANAAILVRGGDAGDLTLHPQGYSGILRMPPDSLPRVLRVRAGRSGRDTERRKGRPDASGIGWVYQYVLKDTTGRLDLAELRALQDFTVRPALQAVTGVAEVASPESVGYALEQAAAMAHTLKAG